MSNVRSPREVAAELTELWSPRVVAEVDDSYVKVAKLHGVFGCTRTKVKTSCFSCSRATYALRWRAQ